MFSPHKSRLLFLLLFAIALIALLTAFRCSSDGECAQALLYNPALLYALHSLAERALL